MAVFSTNQNRHLYVANAYSASVSDASNEGTIGGVKVIGEGKDKELVFFYRGADNTLKSDRIQLENLNYAKAFEAESLAIPLKSVNVTLDPNVNGGAPVAGQDYILRINLRQWIGASDQHQYFKDGVVHATASMTAPQFYQKMVDSLNAAFAREIGATKTSNPYFTFDSTNGITITEKEQEWHLGTFAQERVLFEVDPTTIFVGGEDVEWGIVADQTPVKSGDPSIGYTWTPSLVYTGASKNAVTNGKQIADLEYFCMGERGDQYRGIGWPNIVPTQYMLKDASKGYHVLEFHHGFRDEGVNSYRSEKDITIVAEDDSVLNGLIGAINTAVSAVDSSWVNIATI